jgi:predicted nucleotidyltransferase
LFILFHAAGNAGRLYEEAFSLLESCKYDVELAGAALLGNDVKQILGEPTRRALLDVLGDPVKLDRLVIHMDRSLGAVAAIPSGFIKQFERGLGLIAL